MIMKCWNLYSNNTWVGMAMGRNEEEAIQYAKCFLPNFFGRHDTLSVKPYGIHNKEEEE